MSVDIGIWPEAVQCVNVSGGMSVHEKYMVPQNQTP